MRVKMHVDNITASMDAGVRLDLDKLDAFGGRKVRSVSTCNSRMYRLKACSAVRFFRSGRIVFNSTDMMGLYESRDTVVSALCGMGIPEDGFSDLVIDNIEASGDSGVRVDLTRLAVGLGPEHTEYEPEQFPGLIYRPDASRTTLLVFGNGKLVCTGVRTPEGIMGAVGSFCSALDAVIGGQDASPQREARSRRPRRP